MTLAPESSKVAVLGLGYVGLPLAVAFGKTLQTVGFDINARRIAELNERRDRTLEIDAEELAASKHLTFSSSTDDLADCTVFIITVPTPIDSSNRPDLTALLRASETVGKVLKWVDVVIYESTVYPGATEEDCVPVLENISGLTFNVDFFCGYSPERANPGDREHRLATIMKVTAGSTPEIADFVDGLYRTIVTAGTHKAPSIRVAEAAKVIENTQRDLNIDTEAVLQAAGTKWNFLPFRPGLVGGHCIGVDPYYLTHKAQLAGYHPEVILAGRRINDGMGNYVVAQLVKAMVRKRIQVEGARVLILGLAFKENCPDLRNTRVVDIIEELKGYNISADVHDPWIDEGEAQHEYGISPVSTPKAGAYDAIVMAVAHRQFREMGPEGVRAFGAESHVLYDLKSLLPAGSADLRL